MGEDPSLLDSAREFGRFFAIITRSYSQGDQSIHSAETKAQIPRVTGDLASFKRLPESFEPNFNWIILGLKG